MPGQVKCNSCKQLAFGQTPQEHSNLLQSTLYEVKQEDSDSEYRLSSPEEDLLEKPFTNTRETAIEILDSSPSPPLVTQHCTTFPLLLELEGIFAKYLKAKPKPELKSELSPKPLYNPYDNIPWLDYLGPQALLNLSMAQTLLSHTFTLITRLEKLPPISAGLTIAKKAQELASEAQRKEKV